VGVPDPANDAEAMAMVLTGLRHLAVADPTALATAAQAECLQSLEQAEAILTAARAWYLSAFTASQGYSADADYSATSWLIHRTRVTKGAARGHLGWARRTDTHPQVLTALAEGTVVSESMARVICQWTDKLPQACRPDADEILLVAAQAGGHQEDIAALAAEIYARSLPEDHDDQSGLDFEDRQVRVETTFEGAGVISGDLTPRMRRRGHRGPGIAICSGGRRGHPDPGPALPRRAGRGDAPTRGQWPAPGAGRAAGQGVGPRVAGRAARDG
jgi:hypothetical protein